MDFWTFFILLEISRITDNTTYVLYQKYKWKLHLLTVGLPTALLYCVYLVDSGNGK